MKRDIQFERFYKHPPQRVWKALTDPKLIARWMMESDFQPIVGHKFILRGEPNPAYDGIIHAEVILVDEPRQLAYTFRGGFMKHDTTVTWTLTPHDGGTWVRLDHTGFTGLSEVALSAILWIGWRRMLKKMITELDTLASVEHSTL